MMFCDNETAVGLSLWVFISSEVVSLLYWNDSQEAIQERHGTVNYSFYNHVIKVQNWGIENSLLLIPCICILQHWRNDLELLWQKKDLEWMHFDNILTFSSQNGMLKSGTDIKGDSFTFTYILNVCTDAKGNTIELLCDINGYI